MALHHQAYRMMRAFQESLSERGLGFSAEDRSAIDASHAANPMPPGNDPSAEPTAEQQADAEAVREAAMNADYPAEGIAEDDPRLAPIDGVDLTTYVAAAQAIGWSADPALKKRVCRALGIDPDKFDAAGKEWGERIRGDVVFATLYGQLFAAFSGSPEQNF
jgi:hypothetical protein